MKRVKLIQFFLSIILGAFCVIILIDIDLLPFIIPWRQHKVYEKYYQESYSDRANILVKQKKYLEAVDVLKEGLELVTNTDLTSNVIQIHGKIIELCLDAKDFDRAKYELKVKIESYIKLAEIYKGYLEQNSMAISTLGKTIELINKATALPDKQARYYRRTGWIFFHCKEPSKAISYFQKAVLCFQDFKDKINARLAIIKVNINVKQYSTAKNEIEKISRDIFPKDVKRCSKTYCLDSIVNLYARIKAYDSGITNFQKLKAKINNQDDKNILNEYANKLKNLEK